MLGDASGSLACCLSAGLRWINVRFAAAGTHSKGRCVTEAAQPGKERCVGGLGAQGGSDWRCTVGDCQDAALQASRAWMGHCWPHARLTARGLSCPVAGMGGCGGRGSAVALEGAPADCPRVAVGLPQHCHRAGGLHTALATRTL
jgi:hypothetical protein